MNMINVDFHFILAIGILVVNPILILLYLYKKKSKYPTLFLIGIVFVCFTGFSIFVVGLLKDYRLYEEYSNWFGAIPIPFVLLAILFIMMGAYQNVKHNEVQRRIILFSSLMLLLIFLLIVFLVILKFFRS